MSAVLLASFGMGGEHDFYGYPSTVLSDVVESGFVEGSKFKKTHIVIERNSKLRNLFFTKYPGSTCDSCEMDTHKKYPWSDRILDIHHILPLSSGTRVDSKVGTILDDLTSICPTCHRAVHKFYDDYLRSAGRKDFTSEAEARDTYLGAKENILRRGQNA